MKALHPMKSLCSLVRVSAHLAALVATALVASAQTNAAATAKPSEDTVIRLDAFDVTETSTKGYMATNTISGTAMNMPLKEVPMIINVITSEMLAEIVPSNLQAVFAMNSGVTMANREAASGNQSTSWSIRGFRNRNLLVDGVTGGDFVPVQLIDRVETVKGPNTMYGQSDPGGLINIITKRPQGTDRFDFTMRAGSFGLLEGEFDGNVRTANRQVGLRLLGAHTETDGYHVVDGMTKDFYGLSASYQITPSTTLLLQGSESKTRQIPTQRSAFSFQITPTDMNHDGAITNTIVNGVNELTARYENPWLPRAYTSATGENHMEQVSDFLQVGVRHAFNSHLSMQYAYVRTYQLIDDNFREFNTFSVGDNAAAPTVNAADVNHTAEHYLNTTDAHTLNGLLTFSTGPLQHRMLVGGRFTYDLAQNWGFALRAKSGAAELATLNTMIASGRRIRLYLTQADVLSGVQYWLDNVPTTAELQALGTRLSTVDYSETRVGSLYLNDSVSLLNDHLKLLGGVRHIGVRSQSTDIKGAKIGILNNQSKTTGQFGAVYELTSKVSAFADVANSFSPNGTNGNTGVFFPAESSRALEAGFKFDDLLGGRLGGSASVFKIKKENVVASDFNPVTFLNVTELQNAESKGAELELFFNPTKNWQTVIGYTHLNAKVSASQTTALGLGLEGAAPNKLTFWNSYGFSDDTLRGLKIGGGVIVARGPIHQFGTSSSQLVVEDGYTEVNLFARYNTKIAARSVSFGVNASNLTNVFYYASRAATNDPRVIKFSVTLHY